MPQDLPSNVPRLEALLISARPAIDVRAPAEFAQGAMPGAVNLPILDDDERAAVGTTYKNEGPEAARRLGHELVSGDTKQRRIRAWTSFLDKNPDAYLYCWRGGERSGIAAQWLAARGLAPERVPGGYKALRRTCIEALKVNEAEARGWWVLAGRTGSGKTLLIHRLSNAVDLEGLAAHRGSAFGAQDVAQPTLATFENQLACELMRRRGEAIVLEDESRMIGRIAVPESVHAAMKSAPVVLLETPMEQRVANIRQEYVDERLQRRTADELHDLYIGAVNRIRNRLGGLRHGEIVSALDSGFANGEHERWITLLLTWYYDPMYDYQLERKQKRIRFTGNAEATLSFLSDL